MWVACVGPYPFNYLNDLTSLAQKSQRCLVMRTSRVWLRRRQVIATERRGSTGIDEGLWSLAAHSQPEGRAHLDVQSVRSRFERLLLAKCE
jgi:hypothetical protein